MKKYFYNGLVLSMLFVFSTSINAQQSHQPHIFIVLADDLGLGDLGCTGHPFIKTPNIDSFASHGLKLHFYTGAPICSPSRTALMSGRFPQAVGIPDNIDTGNDSPSFFRFSLSEITLPEILKNSGYNTFHTGKWHLTPQYSSTSIKKFGFTQSFSNADSINNAWQYFNAAMQLIDSSLINYPEKPIFSYIALNEPHDPYRSRLLPNINIIETEQYDTITSRVTCHFDVNPQELDAAFFDSLQLFYATITNLDKAFGHFLAHLDSLGIRDSSIVLFISDNGPSLMGYGTPSCQLSGQKYKLSEGGIRVPAIIQWPGRWDDGDSVRTPIAMVDWLPTLAEIANAPISNRAALHGQDVSPLLDHIDTIRKSPLYWFFTDAKKRNVFPGLGERNYIHTAFLEPSGRFKLAGTLECFPENEDLLLTQFIRRAMLNKSAFRLYDLKNNPRETTDVSKVFPEQFEKMKRELIYFDRKYRREMPNFFTPWSTNIINQSCSNTSIVQDEAKLLCNDSVIDAAYMTSVPDVSSLVAIDLPNIAYSPFQLQQYPTAGTALNGKNIDVYLLLENNVVANCRFQLYNLCLPPFSLFAQVVSESSVNIVWSIQEMHPIQGFHLQYCSLPDCTWQDVFLDAFSWQMNNLNVGTQYQFRIRTICATNDTSTWSEIVTFFWDSSASCGNTPQSTVIPTSSTTAVLFNDYILGASGYSIKLIKIGTTDTIMLTTTSLEFEFSNLDSTATYAFQIMANCDIEPTVWSDWQFFTMVKFNQIEPVHEVNIDPTWVPNPADLGFVINTMNKNPADLRLYNAVGALIEERKKYISGTFWPTSHLPEGLYYLSITYPNGQRKALTGCIFH